MSYTTLKEMRSLVARRQAFRGNNVYATWEGDWYVVYSYGIHFPMYIYDLPSQQWLGTNDKYSVTTSRHQTACAPPRVDQWHDLAFMKKVAVAGLRHLLAVRVIAGVAA